MDKIGGCQIALDGLVISKYVEDITGRHLTPFATAYPIGQPPGDPLTGAEMTNTQQHMTLGIEINPYQQEPPVRDVSAREAALADMRRQQCLGGVVPLATDTETGDGRQWSTIDLAGGLQIGRDGSFYLPIPVSTPHGGAVALPNYDDMFGVLHWQQRAYRAEEARDVADRLLFEVVEVRDQLARRCAEQARHIADLLAMNEEERPIKPDVFAAIETHQKAGQR